jgi:hypothetical protein
VRGCRHLKLSICGSKKLTGDVGLKGDPPGHRYGWHEVRKRVSLRSKAKHLKRPQRTVAQSQARGRGICKSPAQVRRRAQGGICAVELPKGICDGRIVVAARCANAGAGNEDCGGTHVQNTIDPSGLTAIAFAESSDKDPGPLYRFAQRTTPVDALYATVP